MFIGIIDAPWFPWVAGGTFLAGIVRGIAGFGGALVLIPILGAFLGPAAAVPILNAVDCVAAAPLLPRAWRQCDWREVAPLLAGALVLLPVGVLILKSLDAVLLRHVTAVVLLVAVALMALGKTLVERRTAPSSAAIGALSGLMAGSIGLSGPPIALFWLDKRVPPLVSRANVIVYTALITVAVIGVTLWEGLFTAHPRHLPAAHPPLCHRHLARRPRLQAHVGRDVSLRGSGARGRGSGGDFAEVGYHQPVCGSVSV